MDKTYIESVRLLLESAPAIFETPHFVMKGGTAINLFIEDMPRLSVDIDVVYTYHQGHNCAVHEVLFSRDADIQKRICGANVRFGSWTVSKGK
jgi:hypothetical protein